jgi:transcriptional antiterminator NusG
MSSAQTNTAGNSGTPGIPGRFDWYVLRVQSGRENKVRDNLDRRVKAAGLDEAVNQILVPTETVTEVKGGKKRVSKKKIFPGYVMVEMQLNDDLWFLIRETSGIGDFVGTHGKPVPMEEHEVARILGDMERQEEKPTLKIDFSPGDTVKIKEGPFENFDAVVEEVIEAKGIVKVTVTIFGRATEVELEYWMVEAI